MTMLQQLFVAQRRQCCKVRNFRNASAMYQATIASNGNYISCNSSTSSRGLYIAGSRAVSTISTGNFSSFFDKSTPKGGNPTAVRNANYFHTTSPVKGVAASVDTLKGEPYKVLIANRGEIAKRVIETCQKFGFKTVAVYSTADSKAPHVTLADEAVCIGPAASSKSYLDFKKVLKAVELTGADAVHPGYGFLSENAKFAKAVMDQGKIWLGPPTSAVVDMGDKLRSKEIAKAAGVRIIPGYEGTIDSYEHALDIVHGRNNYDAVEYPILLKAAAGGGGKGMRICYNDADLKEGFALAKGEALNFFSDDRLLIEKYIENPHHIEFQVLCAPTADNKIQVVCFPERECSIQRRNQKIIEESPSTLLSPETRRKMIEQVTLLCQNVGYQSAGTVEFLVDEKQNFYFLEMNTRLQVEHPVSEAVCNVDLVKGMLYVGGGWGLPDEFNPPQEPGQTEGLDPEPIILPWKGHAIEARIYAEDPLKGFLPSTGTLLPYLQPPAIAKSTDIKYDRTYTRVDSGILQGSIVSPFYDPMLSKVISYSPNSRKEAIETLSKSLDQYIIEGVKHNALLVNDVLRNEDFIKGDTPTSFLATHYPNKGTFNGVQLSTKERQEFAISALAVNLSLNTENKNKPVVVKLGGMFSSEAYQITMSDSGKVDIQTLQSEDGNDDNVKTFTLDVPVKYEPERHLAEVSIDGVSRFIQVLRNEEENTTGSLAGGGSGSNVGQGDFTVQMYGAKMNVFVFNSVREYELAKHMKPPKEKVFDRNHVHSPMPGTLVSFAVSEGDVVESGQELCIVEAMKMQNVVKALRAGTISKLNVAAGDSLKAEQVILEFVDEGLEEKQE